MGKPGNPLSVFDEMKCAESYMGEPGASMSQSPPTAGLRSRWVYGSPRSLSARAAATPAGPAPMMQVSRMVLLIDDCVHPRCTSDNFTRGKVLKDAERGVALDTRRPRTPRSRGVLTHELPLLEALVARPALVPVERVHLNVLGDLARTCAVPVVRGKDRGRRADLIEQPDAEQGGRVRSLGEGD